MPLTPTCDLHSHTLHSDGVLTPEALVELVASRGVAVLALTDHDTLDGLPGAQRRGAELQVEIVPGIELSIDEQGQDIHLLGYFISQPEVLREALEELRSERELRAARIVARLGELGIAIEYEAVRARALGGIVGRPHVAEEMVARGHATSMNDAFDRFLATDRPAYLTKRALRLREGAALLRRAGAVPVVAHPGPSGLSPLVPELRDCGVLGIEVWHPKHDAQQVRRFLRLAHKYDLVPTGGSDFHREWPGCSLPGDLEIPLDVVDAVRLLAG